MFFGREEELEKLYRLSHLNKAALVVCRGRRRIGKSTLIQQFGKKFDFFYEYQGISPRKKITNSDQLNNFSRLTAAQFDLPALTFANWGEAFALLAKLTEKQQALVFLDEISWMGANDKDFAGQLKIAWDTKFKKNDNLIVVLCGSVSSWIDLNILNSADFLGRISLRIDLDELPLHHCNQFWRNRKQRISAFEKFKILSITGGVPRYLEELRFDESAEQNIAHMCFDPSGILFNEFDSIFNDIFFKKAGVYKKIVHTLINRSLSFSDICQKLDVSPNGVISGYLSDLELSGFVRRDHTHSLISGKQSKLSKYTVCDNYIRFYLKYIEPEKEKIKKGLFRFKSLENLAGFDTIMGFQLENLVMNNLASIVKLLKIPPESIVNATPYFQNKTVRQHACQVDLLIHTKNALYVCEVKFSKRVGKKVIAEVQGKIDKLKCSRQLSIRPVLIHVGEVADSVIEENFFDRIISLGELL